LSIREGVDYPETMHNLLSQRLVDLLSFIIHTEADSFQTRLGPQGEVLSSCVDRQRFHAGPEPTFCFDADPDPDPILKLGQVS
jgi:hypothetical protein